MRPSFVTQDDLIQCNLRSCLDPAQLMIVENLLDENSIGSSLTLKLNEKVRLPKMNVYLMDFRPQLSKAWKVSL